MNRFHFQQATLRTWIRFPVLLRCLSAHPVLIHHDHRCSSKSRINLDASTLSVSPAANTKTSATHNSAKILEFGFDNQELRNIRLYGMGNLRRALNRSNPRVCHRFSARAGTHGMGISYSALIGALAHDHPNSIPADPIIWVRWSGDWEKKPHGKPNQSNPIQSNGISPPDITKLGN